MPDTIDVREAKTQFSWLLARPHPGEEIVLSKAGKPDARWVPSEKPKRKRGFIKGGVVDRFFEPLPDAKLDAWEGQ